MGWGWGGGWGGVGWGVGCIHRNTCKIMKVLAFKVAPLSIRTRGLGLAGGVLERFAHMLLFTVLAASENTEMLLFTVFGHAKPSHTLRKKRPEPTTKTKTSTRKKPKAQKALGSPKNGLRAYGFVPRKRLFQKSKKGLTRMPHPKQKPKKSQTRAPGRPLLPQRPKGPQQKALKRPAPAPSPHPHP